MTTQDALPAPGRDIALLLARLLMASLFLVSGTQKIIDYKGAAAYAGGHGIPYPLYLMWAVILMEIVAGLALASGRGAKPAAIVLAVWMIVVGPWFHQFWNSPPPMWQMMFDDFFHHLVMIGGMIYVAVFGPGRLVLGSPRQTS